MIGSSLLGILPYRGNGHKRYIFFESLVVGGLLALGERTSLCLVCTATTSGQYSPVWPLHSGSKGLLCFLAAPVLKLTVVM